MVEVRVGDRGGGLDVAAAAAAAIAHCLNLWVAGIAKCVRSFRNPEPATTPSLHSVARLLTLPCPPHPLPQVDSAILAHPGVAEAVCFAAPDEKYGEVVAAAVVLNEQGKGMANIGGWPSLGCQLLPPLL